MEVQEGGDMAMLMADDVVVWQKPAQHCKAIILQLKINEKKKNQSNSHTMKCMHVYMCVRLVISDSLQPFGLEPARLLCPWDFSDKNTGVEVPQMYRS